MMKFYKTTLVIFAILLMANYMGMTQSLLDSLFDERTSKYADYDQFKLNMNERTWLNLVELGNRASSLIETDNFIVTEYLAYERNRNEELLDHIEKLHLEVGLLKREAEIREMQMTEKNNYANTLLIIIGCAALLVIIMLIVLINRHTRYQSAKLEVDRLWTLKEDPQYNHLQSDELTMLADQVNKLAEENDLLKKELSEIKGKKSEAMEALKKEIRSRRVVEKEIKDLISQIKKK